MRANNQALNGRATKHLPARALERRVNRTLRILRIADVPDNRCGGMSRVMYYTGDVLAEQGHTVDYVFSKELISAVPANVRRFWIPWLVPGIVAQRQRQRGRYDVIELHEPLALGYVLARRRDKRLPPAVAITYGVEDRSRAAAFSYRRNKRLAIACKTRLAARALAWQARRGIQGCAAVICFNSEDRDLLARTGDPQRVVVSHSGITDRFLEAGRQAWARRSANAGILFLGTWIERKGVLDLVPAVSQVLRERPDAYFTAAGCGVAAPAVVRQFEPALQGRITALPWIQSEEELIALFARHAIFVLPSIFEGQPLSLLEAAAMGLAPVTTNVCGMRDFVRHEENGLLVQPGDVEGLTANLLRLVCDPALTSRLAREAQNSVQTMTWRSAAAKMLEAYQIACLVQR